MVGAAKLLVLSLARTLLAPTPTTVTPARWPLAPPELVPLVRIKFAAVPCVAPVVLTVKDAWSYTLTVAAVEPLNVALPPAVWFVALVITGFTVKVPLVVPAMYVKPELVEEPPFFAKPVPLVVEPPIDPLVAVAPRPAKSSVSAVPVPVFVIVLLMDVDPLVNIFAVVAADERE